MAREDRTTTEEDAGRLARSQAEPEDDSRASLRAAQSGARWYCPECGVHEGYEHMSKCSSEGGV